MRLDRLDVGRDVWRGVYDLSEWDEESEESGFCAMDANRFPKLKYRIYQKALWVPFSKRPGVALQSHWNYSGIQDVDAWSNCPYVELFINKKSYGIVEPDQATRRCTRKRFIGNRVLLRRLDWIMISVCLLRKDRVVR